MSSVGSGVHGAAPVLSQLPSFYAHNRQLHSLTLRFPQPPSFKQYYVLRIVPLVDLLQPVATHFTSLRILAIHWNLGPDDAWTQWGVSFEPIHSAPALELVICHYTHFELYLYIELLRVHTGNCSCSC